MKKRINITIEDHVLNMVDELAKSRGIDRSTMISVLIYDSYNLIDSVEDSSVSDRMINDFCRIY